MVQRLGRYWRVRLQLCLVHDDGARSGRRRIAKGIQYVDRQTRRGFSIVKAARLARKKGHKRLHFVAVTLMAEHKSKGFKTRIDTAAD